MTTLRPYQNKLINDIYDAFTTCRRVMLQLPTGGGKTIVFSELVRRANEKGSRTLILAHRTELIQQAYNKMREIGVFGGIIQGDNKMQLYNKVQIASVQTLVRRMDKFESDYTFDFIICDEAHHAAAKTYKAIFEKYPNAYILGVSATPCRSDGKGFRDIFDAIVCGTDVKELIHLGFLVPPKVFVRPLQVNLFKVKKTGGDYNEKALMDVMSDDKGLLNSLPQAWNKHAKGLKTVVFAVNIFHSKDICKIYNQYGIPAAHLDGFTPDAERQKILKDFKEGKYQILSNVGIVTEGFDLPEIGCVQLVRPTQSLGLYLQMVGRGARPAPNKENYILLDHANCVEMHGFPTRQRAWNLNGVKDKKETKLVRKQEQSEEGFYDENLKIEIGENTVELVEIEIEIEIDKAINDFDGFVESAKKKGWKLGAAWFKFVEKYPNPTYLQMLYIQTKLGYKKEWIVNKMREIQLLKSDSLKNNNAT